MKKSFFLFSIVVLLNSHAMSQMYVAWNGNVGIGTTTPSCKFQIKSSTNDFTFKPSNSGNLEIGGYDGNSNSTITFWHSSAGFNKLIAKSFSKSSDSTLKSNIHRLENSINILNRINGYSYFYSEDANQRGRKEYGVIAQEVERVLPELVEVVKDIKVVDYDGLIPFLIEAFKEQQNQIESLTQEVSMLKQTLLQYDDEQKNNPSQNFILNENNDNQPHVYQNAPNPFNLTTTIKCFIPENISNSQLCVYDTKGNLIKCISILERGLVDVQIQASTLTAGIYAYILITDGRISEAKQMILTK
ncbi:MAG: tail fiber domain-containing protein [Bacteroidales bacterium]|nr:tail fiber domain-containing protein [Bacteroidales bacterium]